MMKNDVDTTAALNSLGIKRGSGIKSELFDDLVKLAEDSIAGVKSYSHAYALKGAIMPTVKRVFENGTDKQWKIYKSLLDRVHELCDEHTKHSYDCVARKVWS